jgi:ATP-dependent helicase HrpB
MLSLPIDPLLPDIVAHLAASPSLVLEAPPGAGKTTRVPRALFESAPDDPREIVVLEPRRIAARMAAARVAEERGEELGAAIGYQVRYEDVTSARTRVRFVTEAILTRRLVSDPGLPRVRAVVLDEFHERNLHGDVALAWLRRLQRTTRPDLRIVVMSATLDAKPAAEFLGCTMMRSEGRRFEVELEHLAADDDRPLAAQVASAVRALLAAGNLDGDVLVFLPGAADIRRAREALEKLAIEHDLLVVPLHGDLPPAEQDIALRRAAKRKVILSTNVAESSVTIEGVQAVVDSGLARVASHDPWSGLPQLVTAKISRASAVQRAGRAGRTRAGKCVRLYTKGDFERRPDHDAPEIARQDLTALVLELRAAGMSDLEWLDAPPPVAVSSAESLLLHLGAFEKDAQAAIALTARGKRMLRFPVHPRAARLLIEAEDRNVVDDGAIVAALLGEKDIRVAAKARFGDHARELLPTEKSDLVALLDLFREAEDARFSSGALRAIGLDAGATHGVDRARKQLARLCRARGGAPGGEDALLMCILAGYSDRVAKRLKSGGRGLALAGGAGAAQLAEESVVRHAEWMVAVEADDRSTPRGRTGTVVRVASAIEPEWLIDLHPERIVESSAITFVRGPNRVEATSRLSYEGLVLEESPAANASDEEIARVLAEAALDAGPAKFAPENALARWRARARFAREVDPSIDEITDDIVKSALADMAQGKRSFAELASQSLVDALQGRLGSMQCARIAKLAPERVTLARGRTVPVEYEAGKPPFVASRLQDFFGMHDTPKVGGGQVPVTLHLLAPNKRAVQVTPDLAGFWKRHYPAIRKELARRYPKHAWPEDPES